MRTPRALPLLLLRGFHNGCHVGAAARDQNHNVLHLPVIIPAMSTPSAPPPAPSPQRSPRAGHVDGKKPARCPTATPCRSMVWSPVCNQKTSRDPVMQLTDAEAQRALDSLKLLTLVFESSGNRTTRWEHNFQRGVGVPDQSAVLLGLLMLRGPQTAGELRINAERWHRFADISSVEAFWTNCKTAAQKRRPAGRAAAPRARRPRARWAHLLCGPVDTSQPSYGGHPPPHWTPAPPCKPAYKRWRPKWPACNHGAPPVRRAGPGAWVDACHHPDRTETNDRATKQNQWRQAAMDLAFTPKSRPSREEVRTWVQTNLPRNLPQGAQRPAPDPRRYAGLGQDSGQKGWLAFGWLARSLAAPAGRPCKKHLFEEECALAGAPRIIPSAPSWWPR